MRSASANCVGTNAFDAEPEVQERRQGKKNKGGSKHLKNLKLEKNTMVNYFLVWGGGGGRITKVCGESRGRH